ncbi:MAG: tetratricopeptide repeat protein [Bacteroidales bacterium]|nr:tetratricopeptide repeat protein [Bacteroidales bacterium]
MIKKAPLYENIYQNAIITINKFESIDKRISEASIFYKVNPNDYFLNYNLGKWYGQYKNNIDTAIYFLEKAVRFNKNSKEALKDLGVAYGFSQRYTDAVAVLQRVLKLDPNDEQTYFNLGLTYSFLGEHKSALQYFEYLATQFPQNSS